MNISERLKAAAQGFSSGNITVVERLHPEDRLLGVSGWASFFSAGYLACEVTKARAAGSLPVAVYKKVKGGREKLTDHPLTKLLSGQANEFETGTDLLQWAWIYRDTFGTAYIWVEYKQGKPVALYPITSSVNVVYDNTKPRKSRLTYEVNAGCKYVPEGNYKPYEIIAIKSPISKNGGLEGESIAKYAAAEIGLSINLEAYYREMLNGGNHTPGHVEMPEGKTPNSKLTEAMENALKTKRGIENTSKTPIFWEGAKWVQNQQTMKDADVVQQQTWVLQQVCRCTSVPPMKVYENSRLTYSNSEQQRIEFATDTMMPEVSAVESAFRRVLDEMGETDCYLHFELNGLMRGDKQAQASYYQLMRYACIYNGNEIRAFEDQNWVEGLDAYLVPANYALLENGEITTVTQGANPAVGTPANYLTPLLSDAYDRIESRLEKDGDTEKTREFAQTVLTPFSKSFAELRAQFDMQSEIERMLNAKN